MVSIDKCFKKGLKKKLFFRMLIVLPLLNLILVSFQIQQQTALLQVSVSKQMQSLI